MQTILVIITFIISAGFLIKKFIWGPIFETRQKAIKTLDGDRTKCGDKNCGCH